uniref:Candidate secreted effector n=1 Tax=Meloidogyne incognita TaxID=6306 RepID=A0A914MQI5_MELIC
MDAISIAPDLRFKVSANQNGCYIHSTGFAIQSIANQNGCYIHSTGFAIQSIANQNGCYIHSTGFAIQRTGLGGGPSGGSKRRLFFVGGLSLLCHRKWAFKCELLLYTL